MSAAPHRLLVLDTSTEWCSVALWLDGSILARRENAGQAHSSRLIAMIDGLLAESGAALRELDAIAYGAGPGSFTGLRIACAVTQGLALGADLPVIGVSTLQSIAEQTGEDAVLVALDARMAEVYWGAYLRDGDGWNTVVEPALALPDTLFVPHGHNWVGAGNGFTALGSILIPRLGDRLRRIDSELMPDAAAMATLAVRAWMRGEVTDAALAAPVYLRDKVAKTVAERSNKAAA